MARQTLESKYICSIYPGDLPSVKYYVGVNPSSDSSRCTAYEMKGVPKGEEPEVIEVSDAFENIQDILGSTRKKRAFMSKLVPCDRIVTNLLNYWAGNMVGVPAGIGPGIMEIANRAPTTAELEELTRRQTAFFEFMFAEGERLMADRRMKEITQPMVLAAEWLGRKTTWASKTFTNMVPCKKCRQDIPFDASVCHLCGRDQDDKASATSASNSEVEELRKQVAMLVAAHVTSTAQAAGQPLPIPPQSGKSMAIPPTIQAKPLPEKPVAQP